MLIFTRKMGERFMIGDDVVVTILSFKGGQVRVGIAAPKTIKVHREEVFNREKGEATPRKAGVYR